jgi:phosphatidate cytidylyltransferase
MSKIRSMSNLQQRIIAGVIGAVFVVTAIILNRWSYFALFSLIMIVCLIELYNHLLTKEQVRDKWYGIIMGFIINTIVFLICAGYLSIVFLLTIPVLIMTAFILKLFHPEDTNPFRSLATTMLAQFYLVLPFSCLHFIAFGGVTAYRYYIVLGVLLMLWASDTGAYFFGKTMGKNKLFERVSPKKTWEGFFGGLITSGFIAFILSRYFTDISLANWIVMSVLIVVFGTLGDLVESLFKRSLQIKDSGSLIPGHGGFLDRFDGLFIALPFIAAYLALIV